MSDDLTNAQRAALHDITRNPHKSGRFWRHAHSPIVLSSLERKGLAVGAMCNPFAVTVIAKSWSATDAGRAALGDQP